MLKGNFVLIKGPKANKSLSEAVAGDLLCYNNDKLYIYPSSKYEGTPVGVVVIPTSHNVYGNGSCGVMSLVNMSYQTPDTGWDGTDYPNKITMFYGGKDSEPISYYDKVNYVGETYNGDASRLSSSPKSATVSGTLLPSDLWHNKEHSIVNPYDTDTSYYDDDSCSPSPYNEDDSRNIAYYQTSAPSDKTNALSDFKGKENTDVLLDFAISQSDWKTASTITNSSENGYYPSACCCWRFHTVGTKQGDWHLPSCGELGYIVPKLLLIEKAITQSGKEGDFYRLYHNNTVTDLYLSSTNMDEDRLRAVWLYNCELTWHDKNSLGVVRAFMQVGPDMVSE